MSVIVRPVSTVSIAGTTFPVESGTVSLDLSRVPYARASLELVWTPAAAELSALDDARVLIQCADEQAGTSRAFDLVVTNVDTTQELPRRVNVQAASDEHLLMTWEPLAVDTGAWQYQASLRAVCNYVLAKIGASLAPGGPDADMTAYWDATNLLENPEPHNNTNGWSGEQGVGHGPSTIELVTGTGPDGTSRDLIQLTPDGSADLLQARASSVRITPGRAIAGAGWIRRSSTGNVLAAFDWIDRDGKRISATNGTVVAVSAGAWTRVSVVGTPPPGTVEARFLLRAQGPISSSEVVRACRGVLVDGWNVVEYFDGGSPTDEHYTYAWSGDPDASTSDRTAIAPSDPDVFRWEPGVSAWDFLVNLTTVAGLLLFCDEARTWRLVDPQTYTVPGTVDLSGARVTARANRTDRAARVDGVIVTYRWRDRDGNEREQRDTAGAPGIVERLDVERPWPGAGAASRILARRTQRGKTQTTTSAVDWNATPTMATTGADQLGAVRSVEFGLTGGLMTIERIGGDA